MNSDDVNQEQKAPTPNERPACWDLVIADMKARDAHGRRHYGTPLQPANGRNPLVDSYQERLDDLVYSRQAIFELNEVATNARRAMELYRWLMTSPTSDHGPILKELGQKIVALQDATAPYLTT